MAVKWGIHLHNLLNMRNQLKSGWKSMASHLPRQPVHQRQATSQEVLSKQAASSESLCAARRSLRDGGPRMRFRDPNAPHFKFTRSDFKQATRPTSTAHVQKYRASCSEEERKFNREDAKLKQQSYSCKVCGRLDHSAKDAKRCPMQ